MLAPRHTGPNGAKHLIRRATEWTRTGAEEVTNPCRLWPPALVSTLGLPAAALDDRQDGIEELVLRALVERQIPRCVGHDSRPDVRRQGSEEECHWV